MKDLSTSFQSGASKLQEDSPREVLATESGKPELDPQDTEVEGENRLPKIFM